MRIRNVIVAGPTGKAKSSLIKAFSDDTFKSPEQVAMGKKGNSYVVEFGRTKIDNDTYLYLANLPIEEHFDFLWERLADGLLGFMVVVDIRDTADKAAAKAQISRVKDLTDTPMVVVFIGVTDSGDPNVAALCKELGIAPKDEPVCGAAGKATAKAAMSKLLDLGIKMQKKVTA